MGCIWFGERRDLDPDTDRRRDSPAHGAVGLPGRSGAGLSRCAGRMAAILREPGAGIGSSMKSSNAGQAQAASELISKRISELGDWRGATLGRMRKLVKEA